MGKEVEEYYANCRPQEGGAKEAHRSVELEQQPMSGACIGVLMI